MHGKYNVKFSVAQQAKSVYNYQRLKEKLHKTNASIWFNKICRTEQLTIKYIQITVKGNTQRSQNTKKVATAHRLNQEIKFLYKKKCMLNKQLYIAHLDCANYWHKFMVLYTNDDTT
jgi:hypothetical protein